MTSSLPALYSLFALSASSGAPATLDHGVAAFPALAGQLAVKGSLILLAAWAATQVLRRASAATRHLIWTAAAGALLALPLFTAALPAWRIGRPGWMRSRPETARPVASTGAGSAVAPAVEPASSLNAQRSAAVSRKAGAPPRWSRIPAAWLLLGWAAGLAIVVGRLGLGTLRVSQIARRACPMNDARGLERDLARELGLRCPVSVLISDRPIMPMAWGVLRPVILLPASAAHWPDARLRAVLAHELAHVGRRDGLTQLLARVACGIYWFNPLVWLAARELRHERERASDDRVLGLGTQASDYAAHLVDLARMLRRAEASWSMAVPMASPSHLEARVVAVLNPRVNRGTVSPARAAAVLLAAVALLTPLAALRAAAEKAPGKIWGTVYDPSGAVVPDATVTISNPATKVTQSVSTGQEGVYEFPDIPAGHYDVEVSHFGFGFFRRDLQLDARASLRLDVTLDPGRVNETVDVVAKAPRTASYQGK
ncbi:MAG TPA: M56 family metallopeptidase, partial [Terriglobia bacterium]|nr:M56 family metallopeptidase [Terriglobia bacterium]